MNLQRADYRHRHRRLNVAFPERSYGLQVAQGGQFEA